MTTLRQLNFSRGEIAPSLYGRVDLAQYSTGLRTMRNFFVLRHGGAANRPGTSWLCEVKDSSKVVRLIPWRFNDSQTYMLEFGDQYIRIIRDGAQVSDLTLTITGITNANPAVLSYTGTDPANGDEFTITGVGGMTQVNGRNFKVVNVNAGANTFEMDYLDGSNVNSTTWGTYTSGGSAARVYTITSPYVEADLATLNYDQSADVMTIAHQNYAPRELTRSGHASWTLSSITFAPSISKPTNLNAGAGTLHSYKVTAVKDESFEESLPSTADDGGVAEPTPSAPISLTWTASSGAREYNVYRALNDVYGFIGVAGSTSFSDIGYTPDTTDTPPDTRNPFSSDYPGVVAYIQQRRVFANTPLYPEKVYCSRLGFYKNFSISTPVQDDSAVTFTVAGRQVNAIRNIIDLDAFILLTTAGEHVAEGNSAGIVTPTEINLKQKAYVGSGTVNPIVTGTTALYLTPDNKLVRDLWFDVNGLQGTDRTIFSSHLFDNHTIDDLTITRSPNPIGWFVRDDGVLLGLTYLREQEVFGWHRHDFDGTVENVASIQEDGVDRLYLVIKRTINGATKRYIERLNVRTIDDVIDYVGVDCALTYDGRNTGSTTMTLSGGTNWTYDETLTLTASAGYFTSADVGNTIEITGTDGTVLICTITAYTSTTVVSVQTQMTVPVAMRSTAFTTWAKGVDELTNLWHIEGEEVSVFADRYVISNPNNPEDTSTLTVTNGTITLPAPRTVIHVGQPIIADLETLNIDTPDGETMVDKTKLISQVTMHVENTRGLFAGSQPPTDDDTDPLEGLSQLKIRSSESYADPVELASDVVDIPFDGTWNNNGRVFIRQVDPIPATILSIAPSGRIPLRNTKGQISG